MKTVLALWNSGNKGKSETLRFLANLLITNFNNYIAIEPVPALVPADRDFRLVIKINGKIIGIESQGDPNTNLRGRLLDLANKYKCDLIFCSTRTRGDTIAAVEKLANTQRYQLIWTSTYQIDDSAQHDLVNELKAQHILDLMIKMGLL